MIEIHNFLTKEKNIKEGDVGFLSNDGEYVSELGDIKLKRELKVLKVCGGVVKCEVGWL